MLEVVSQRKPYVKQEGDVYVGRPTQWGNPFVIGRDGSREDVILCYEWWLERRPWLIEELAALNPKRLVCWCAPDACHADVLAKALERSQKEA